MQTLLAAVALVTVIGMPAHGQEPAYEATVLKVSRMACGECAKTVEREARKIDGVKTVKVSQPKGEAEITYDPAKTSPEAIARQISDKTGFKAEPPKKK